MYHAYSTCISSSNQGEFKTFPPNGFRSIWLYICHILAISLFQSCISSPLMYQNFPVYKHYGPFYHQFSGRRMVYKIWYNSPNTVFLCSQNILPKSRSCLLLFCTFYLSVSSMHDFYRKVGTVLCMIMTWNSFIKLFWSNTFDRYLIIWNIDLFIRSIYI